MGKNSIEAKARENLRKYGGHISFASDEVFRVLRAEREGTKETNRRNFLKEMKEKWLPRLKKKGVKEGALIEWPVESGRFVTLGKINDTRFMIRGSNVVKGIPVSELARAYGCLDKI